MIWKDAVGNSDANLEQIIASMTHKSLLWNRDVFCNIFNRKRHIEARILGIQNSSIYSSSNSLQTLERQLAAELDNILD